MKKLLLCTLTLLLVSSVASQTPERNTSQEKSAEQYIHESEAQWAGSV
jgi:hypothetical protein